MAPSVGMGYQDAQPSQSRSVSINGPVFVTTPVTGATAAAMLALDVRGWWCRDWVCGGPRVQWSDERVPVCFGLGSSSRELHAPLILPAAAISAFKELARSSAIPDTSAGTSFTIGVSVRAVAMEASPAPMASIHSCNAAMSAGTLLLPKISLSSFRISPPCPELSIAPAFNISVVLVRWA